MSTSRLSVLVSVAVLVAFAPALAGDWVWDDWTWEHQSAAELARAFVAQSYGGIWRPLSLLSTLVVHAVWPDPLPHKLGNLALHLIAVYAVARTASALGAREGAAWAGAALFGLHPGTTEVVCWVGARTEGLPAALLLVGVAAWLNGHRALAGVCLFLAPFGKEAFAAGVITIAVWMWTVRRWDWPVLAAAGLGGVGFVAARIVLLGTGFTRGTPKLDPLPAFGAAAARGAELLMDGSAPDLWNPYVPAPTLGGFVLAGGLLATALARGRPALGAVVASLPPLIPSAIAASSILLLADRYYYTPLAGVGVAFALGVEGLARRGVRPGIVLALAVGVPAGLGIATVGRAFDWRGGELALAASSWEKNPGSPLAAEHYAYAEERWGAGCEVALPAWRVATTRNGVEGLIRCLVKTGGHEEALAIAESAPATSEVARQASIAAAELRDLVNAERWARIAVDRESSWSSTWVQLGYVLALQGRTAEAHTCFTKAVELDPTDDDAREGLARTAPSG